MTRETAVKSSASWRDYLSLAKPKVLALIVFTAIIGMLLAARDFAASPILLIASAIGIGLVAASAAAFNCLVENRRDALMSRTRHRPLPSGRLTVVQTAAFSALLGAMGMATLATFVNPLTMWLTLATFFGYAVVYTLLLKTATPQNIVIGGASGAMPPVLGWAAVAGEITYEPLLLFLIIFTWTPPHFWALALARKDDYARAGLPMLPVTHGGRFTRFSILLYTLMLFAASLLPFAAGMSGYAYFAAALVLGGRFLWMALKIWRTGDDSPDSAVESWRLFAYSVSYLAVLFAALLADYFLVR